MCVTAWLDDLEMHTVGEVRRALGAVVIENEADLAAALAAQGRTVETCCLCVIDCEATARAAGMEWVTPAFKDGDPMEGRFVE